MPNPDTPARVMRVVAETIGCASASIRTDSELKALGADDLDMVDIVMRLEEEFGCELPEDAICEADTVAALVQIVDNGRG